MSPIIEIILTIKHGQAAVEHNFRLRKLLVFDSVIKASMLNKKLIKDYTYEIHKEEGEKM